MSWTVNVRTICNNSAAEEAKVFMESASCQLSLVTTDMPLSTAHLWEAAGHENKHGHGLFQFFHKFDKFKCLVQEMLLKRTVLLSNAIL